jgi:hypothetical protein
VGCYHELGEETSQEFSRSICHHRTLQNIYWLYGYKAVRNLRVGEKGKIVEISDEQMVKEKYGELGN